MCILSDDFLKAKQTLSARLLRMGLRSNVVGGSISLRVHAAIASAGGNVHAIGIGRKVVNGEETQDRCVRIYVVQKIAETLLPPRDRLPSSIDGIPTDVIETPPAFVLAPPCSDNRQARQRPVVAGISVAHHNITVGTLGYFCRSTRPGDDPEKVFVLSNNHVFADVNQAHIGDDLYQPGPADGGTATDHFGDLYRFVDIHLDGTTPNRVDAAIGALRSETPYQVEVCSIGQVQGTTDAIEAMQVRKHGRTTGYTEGVVTDESYDALVGMDHLDPSVVALFENQMRIETIAPYPAFGLGGDSGSLIVEKTAAKAVGLYFAGPGSGVYGIANHIQDVLNEVQIELL